MCAQKIKIFRRLLLVCIIITNSTHAMQRQEIPRSAAEVVHHLLTTVRHGGRCDLELIDCCYYHGDSLRFNHDGSRLVIGRGPYRYVWDAYTGRPLSCFLKLEKDLRADIRCTTFTANDVTTQMFWDFQEELEIVLPGEINSATLNEAKTKIVTASADHTATIWDSGTLRPLCILRGHANAVMAAAFSEDATRVITGSKDRTAIIWDASTGRALKNLPEHDAPVIAVCCNPYHNRVATGTWAGTLYVWDVGHSRVIIAKHFLAPPQPRSLVEQALLVALEHDARLKLKQEALGKKSRLERAITKWLSKPATPVLDPDKINVQAVLANLPAPVRDALQSHYHVPA